MLHTSDAGIVLATKDDKDEILSLYKVQIGREYCPWTCDYPGSDTIDFDLKRDALFVMKEGGRIIAAISIDEDEAVEGLECWDRDLAPAAELSRLAVLPEKQGQGIAKEMLGYGIETIRERGYISVHYLVNKHNVKAIRAYSGFGFDIVGECYLFEQDFWCYEKAL